MNLLMLAIFKIISTVQKKSFRFSMDPFVSMMVEVERGNDAKTSMDVFNAPFELSKEAKRK